MMMRGENTRQGKEAGASFDTLQGMEEGRKKERKGTTHKRISSTLLTATGRENSYRNEKDDEQNKKDTEAKGKK